MIRKAGIGFLVWVMSSACMFGPPQSAEKLAGFTEPGFRMKKDAEGWDVEASAKTKGKTRYKVAPDGTVEFELDLQSDPDGTTRAQGDRLEFFAELRKIEAEGRIAQQQLLNQMIGMVLSFGMRGPAGVPGSPPSAGSGMVGPESP